MGAVEDGTRAEIDKLRVRDVAPGLVETALMLALQLDNAEAPTSAAMVAKELRTTMLELRKVSPQVKGGDALDELTARRAARRGA
jgi:hypothetical protein